MIEEMTFMHVKDESIDKQNKSELNERQMKETHQDLHILVLFIKHIGQKMNDIALLVL
jgi:hypothetical protein